MPVQSYRDMASRVDLRLSLLSSALSCLPSKEMSPKSTLHFVSRVVGLSRVGLR
jgi:hypothetical protein